MLAVQAEQAQLATVVEESVSGVRVIKGFGAEDVQAAKLRVEADDIQRVSLDAARIRSAFLPALDLLPNLGLIAVLGIGGHRVIDGEMTYGQMVEFLQYIALLIVPLRSIGMTVAFGQRAAAALDARRRGAAHRAGRRRSRRSPHVLPDTPPVGAVRFRDVRFGYHPAAPVLDGFDLDIAAGESVALVGATGSGKSTVARLLTRFYDVDDGRIELDGVELSTLTLGDLRHAVAIVFEDTFLFNDTVRGNIAFARPDASLDEVERAAPARRRGRVHRRPARGVRHDDRRAWLLAQRRPASAHRHRPGDPRRPAGARARRRHQRGRPVEGARDPRGDGHGDA